MARVFVHLSDVWGDTDDALGWRREFWRASATEMRDTGEGVVVEPSLEHMARAREVWRDSPCVSVKLLETMDWRDPRFTEVVVNCMGTSSRALQNLDQHLRQTGFRRAGRAWGAAGQTRRYVRPPNMSIWVRAALAELIVQVGAAIVQVRDGWFHKRRFTEWREQTKVRLSKSLTAADVLDREAKSKSAVESYFNVRERLPAGFGLERESWHADINEDPWRSALRCHDQHGLWPISFSYPSEPLDIESDPPYLIAPIIPGFPYSFHDQRSYLASYRQAYLGLTHRKAGWDCFRHVEILASGAVPFMPDIADVPEFSMIHYPKQAMRQVVANMQLLGGPPDTATRQAFRKYFNENLTTRAMASYVLRACGLQDVENILFVDAALGRAADYQSVLTLIGLKQLRGTKCDVLYPVDYVYRDTDRDVHSLYGRGFGYTRVFDGSLRSWRELGAAAPDVADYEVMVVGSISRNLQEASALLDVFPAERTIWIHGEDTPPNPYEAHQMRTSGTHVFVRAIHTRGP